MKRAEHIQAELNEIGAKVLINMPSTMPYSLPINYFATLSDEISDVVKISNLTETQPEWGNKMPFENPGASYFEGLSAQIMAKVDAEPEWSKSNPFAVPNGYFESLPAAIIAKAKTEVPKAKKRVPLFRTMQLAASMALIFFTGFAVIKMNNVKTQDSKFTVTASDADIRNYVDANLDDFDTDLIINGLAQTNSTISLSDAEIKEYLDETGWN